MAQSVVVDTDILIDFAHDYAEWLRGLLKDKSYGVVLSTIVIAEYLTAKSIDDKKELKLAEKTFSFFVKQDFTEEIAKIMGRIMRNKSFPRGTGIADLIIASTAIYLDAPLATRNKSHFQGIPGLRFFEPKEIED